MIVVAVADGAIIDLVLVVVVSNGTVVIVMGNGFVVSIDVMVGILKRVIGLDVIDNVAVVPVGVYGMKCG